MALWCQSVAKRTSPAYNPAMRVPLAAVILCLVLLPACSMWEKQPNTWTGATAGEQLDRLWWQDVKAQRFDQLARHVSATFMGVTANAQLDRAGLLQYLRELQVTDYTLGDFVTQSNGADLMVSYRATFNAIRGTQSVQMTARYLSIWQHTRDGWILTAQTVIPTATQ